MMDDSPIKDAAWSEFQTAFLEHLRHHVDAEDIKAALLADPAAQGMREWIQSMRPDMLETAAGLVKKWGSKDEDKGVG
jgi:hypothetical protein